MRSGSLGSPEALWSFGFMSASAVSLTALCSVGCVDHQRGSKVTSIMSKDREALEPYLPAIS
jgi:hypothetical protein